MTPWWNDATAGWIGGGLGALIGLLGAGVGVTAGLLARKGRGKTLVVALLGLIIGLGVVCLGAGVVAVILGQPYGVFYPLLLIGFIATVVGGVNAPVLLRVYRQAEARRLSAEEIRRT